MRNTGTRGYLGYRGRRSSGRRWIIFALVLILLAAAAFLLAQQYIVYDMDGSYHFELPWSHHGGTQQTSHHGGRQDLEIIIERPEEPEPEKIPLHAQELDASALTADKMNAALAALPEGVNSVAVRLKTVKGELLYPSQLADAAEAKAVAGKDEARAAIETLTASGRYTIARLAMLHDSRYSFAHMVEASVLQRNYKNYVWYAPDSSFYLAPEKEMARQYLCNIAAEVASMGFDELLLDEFGYPTKGRLNNIFTDDREMTMEAALALLADNLRETVSEYGVKLSLTMDEKTVLNGSDEKSGQNLADLAIRFDRIYVPTTADKIPALEEALAPYSAELVPILKTAPAEGDYLLTQGG